MRRASAALLPVLLTTAALAGCLAGTVDEVAAPTRLGPEAWKPGLSAPLYEGVERTVHRVTASDGARLSLTLHLPEGLPADARVPTLLQITPYQAGRPWTPVTGTSAAGFAWESFVLRGAAYVEADARGTNGSDGCLDFGGSLDRQDARDLVAWIRAQPWSDGVVVTDGVSHPGMGSVVAHAAVPDLTAALAHAPVVSYYRDEWYQGAKFEDQLNVFYQAIESAPALHADADAVRAQAAPCTGRTTLEYGQVDGRFTDVWADRDLARHAGEARAPILLTQGFADQNVHPDHVQAYWDALPEDLPKRMILGWWYHSWPDMDGHPAKSAQRHPFWDLRHRWLDATLFGADSGLWDEPRVLVEDSRGVWHEGDRWPLEPSEEVTLHASDDGGLLAEAPASEGEVSYPDLLFPRRGSWNGASAVFRTEPLAEARLVNGAPVVELVASSSAPRTKWVAYLLSESPDGARARVTHGYADSRTWRGEGGWDDLEPGKAYHWTIRLMPTAVVVEEGHRLVLVVASQDSRNPPVTVPFTGVRTSPPPCMHDHRGGCYLPSGILPADTAGRAVNAVHTGPEGTTLRLAWVDPALTQKVPLEGR